MQRWAQEAWVRRVSRGYRDGDVDYGGWGSQSDGGWGEDSLTVAKCRGREEGRSEQE